MTPTEKADAARLLAIWNKKKRSLNLTQEGVALSCGWSSQGAFNNYLHGRNPLNIDAVLKLAQVLQVEPIEIMPGIGNLLPRSAEFEPGPELPDLFRRLPVVGIAQLGPDGHWLGEFSDPSSSEGFCEYATRDPDAYCLRVKGDSMSPTIRSGWLVVVEPNSAVTAGAYVVACTLDGRCMVKEYLYERNSEVTLASINETYGRITLDRAEFERLHVVGAIVPPHKFRPW
jgi:SOS-response transcriptional repressor LexA